MLTLSGEAQPIERYREIVAKRLGSMAKLRQKVVRSRGILQPKWVDVEPDIGYHVNDITLELGASLAQTVSAIMERDFDEDRPLWDLNVVRGYSESEYALMMRVHHAIADGQGTVLLLGNLLDLEPEGGMTLTELARALVEGKNEDTTSDSASLWSRVSAAKDALVEQMVTVPLEHMQALPETIQTINSMALKSPSDLTGSVSDKRVWATDQFPLARVKAAKEYYGVTINDVVLAACASGFRDLLVSRGSSIPADRVVRAAMPISLRKSDDLDSHNSVQILPVDLLVGSYDSASRLEAVSRKTAVAKKSMLPQLTDAVATLTERTLPAPLLSWVMQKATESGNWQIDTFITNVPGPPMQLFFAGDAVTALIPIVPIASGSKVQIVISVLSYNGHLGFAITGDGVAATDIDVLLNGVIEELDRLASAAETGS